MSATVKAIPDGQHSVTPHLVARNASAAIAFYARAFGAVERGRLNCPRTGKVIHAQLAIGDSLVYLCDEFPQMGALSPQSLGGTPVTIHLYVADTDATVDRAVEAGATVKMPVADMFWGDRYGKVTDPFGHEWSIATHIEDVPLEQMTERMGKQFAPES
jgi:PhnB protein